MLVAAFSARGSGTDTSGGAGGSVGGGGGTSGNGTNWRLGRQTSLFIHAEGATTNCSTNCW